jgi:putative spermidine/putrescine transport system ATP-binding protein
MLSVRPERVQLNGAGEHCTNQFDARVKELIYLGDHVRIRLDLAGQHEFMAKAPVSHLDHRLVAGENIRVGIELEHVRALDPLVEA